MASKLRSYEFTNRTYTHYPWEEWSTGIWEIRRGQDYHVEDASMLSTLRGKATRMGMRAKVSNPEEGRIVFQFEEVVVE